MSGAQRAAEIFDRAYPGGVAAFARMGLLHDVDLKEVERKTSMARKMGLKSITSDVDAAAKDANGNAPAVTRSGVKTTTGGKGSVTIVASNNGATIVKGAELIEPKSRRRYRVTSPTKLRQDGTRVSIVGIDRDASKLKAGAELHFVAPAPGCGKYVRVCGKSKSGDVSKGRKAMASMGANGNKPIPFRVASAARPLYSPEAGEPTYAQRIIGEALTRAAGGVLVDVNWLHSTLGLDAGNASRVAKLESLVKDLEALANHNLTAHKSQPLNKRVADLLKDHPLDSVLLELARVADKWSKGNGDGPALRDMMSCLSYKSRQVMGGLKSS